MTIKITIYFVLDTLIVDYDKHVFVFVPKVQWDKNLPRLTPTPQVWS